MYDWGEGSKILKPWVSELGSELGCSTTPWSMLFGLDGDIVKGRPLCLLWATLGVQSLWAWLSRCCLAVQDLGCRCDFLCRLGKAGFSLLKAHGGLGFPGFRPAGSPAFGCFWALRASGLGLDQDVSWALKGSVVPGVFWALLTKAELFCNAGTD